jgi:hypothetical protein
MMLKGTFHPRGMLDWFNDFVNLEEVDYADATENEVVHAIRAFRGR